MRIAKTKSYSEASLEAEIKAENELQKIKRVLIDELYDKIKPFDGVKIKKVNGEKTKKFSDAVEIETPSTGGFRFYLESNRYSLAINIHLHKKIEGHDGNVCRSCYAYFGNIKDNILTVYPYEEIIENNPINTYTAKKVQEARDKVEKLKQELSKAESACYPFKTS
jgi:hypothetical protein